MLRRTMILLVLVLAPAGVAHAETRYGGGTFEPAAKDPYQRSAGLSVRALDDGTAVLRIDGYVRCKSSYYRVAINSFGAYDGATLRRSGRAKLTLSDKVRGVLRYRWSLDATADPAGLRGALRLSGKLKLKGRRKARSCPAGGAQPVRLRPYVRAAGATVASSVNQRFYGLTDQFVSKGAGPGSGIQGALLGSTDAQGRMAVRFTIDPRCPDSKPDLAPTIAIFRNMAINPDGTFSATNTFTRSDRSGRYDYTTIVGGLTRADGIEGTGIVSVLITRPDGTTIKCESGPRFWYALLDA